jgi:hypothetical protein
MLVGPFDFYADQSESVVGSHGSLKVCPYGSG